LPGNCILITGCNDTAEASSAAVSLPAARPKKGQKMVLTSADIYV